MSLELVVIGTKHILRPLITVINIQHLKHSTILDDSDILSGDLRDDILDALRLQLLVHLEEVHALEGPALGNHRLASLQAREALLEGPHTLLILQLELLGVVVAKNEVEGV